VNDTRQHPDHPFMLANIDRQIVGLRRGLEVKNASLWTAEKWGESGTDDIPLFYLTQCVHYMAVFDFDAWDAAVLLGGNELRNYTIHRDRESEGRLIELEREFWKCVETDTPPPAIRVEDLARLYPSTQGRKIATEDIALLVDEYATLNARAKEIDKRKDDIKLEVGRFMADAGDLIDPHDAAVTIATYRSHPESRIDSKKLRAEFPDIALQVEKSNAVRKFLVK
jgi:predicted phage-related endonuclease